VILAHVYQGMTTISNLSHERKRKSKLQGGYAKVDKEAESGSVMQRRVWGWRRYSWELEQRRLGEGDDALVGGLMTQGMIRGFGHDMCQDLVERECVS
jgi:hypothetical protein